MKAIPYRLDVPHALEVEAARLTALVKNLPDDSRSIFEKWDLEDMAKRLTDYAIELRRYQEDYRSVF